MASRSGLKAWPAGTVSLAGTLLVCPVIAGVLVTFVPGVDDWSSALTYSFCIGLLACAIIEGGRRALWAGRPPHPGGLILLCVAGMAIGFLGGTYLAAALLRESPLWLTQADDSGVRTASLLATLVATALVAGASWVRQYTSALRLRTELEEARAQAATRLADEARLRMLRAQLEPHMLFNTLAALRALIAVDPVRAQAMLDRLVAFLRGTLSGSQADRIPLRQEFALLDDYLGLMAIRMGKRLDYQLTLPPELADIPVPALLLQPLAENAIRHGIEPAPAGGRIAVSAAWDDDKVILTVTDTGVGMPAADILAPVPSAQDRAPPDGDPEQACAIDGVGPNAAQARWHGFGMSAVQSRLRASVGPLARLHVDSPWPPDAEGGTRIELRFPRPDLSPVSADTPTTTPAEAGRTAHAAAASPRAAAAAHRAAPSGQAGRTVHAGSSADRAEAAAHPATPHAQAGRTVHPASFPARTGHPIPPAPTPP